MYMYMYCNNNSSRQHRWSIFSHWFH